MFFAPFGGFSSGTLQTLSKDPLTHFGSSPCICLNTLPPTPLTPPPLHLTDGLGHAIGCLRCVWSRIQQEWGTSFRYALMEEISTCRTGCPLSDMHRPAGDKWDKPPCNDIRAARGKRSDWVFWSEIINLDSNYCMSCLFKYLYSHCSIWKCNFKIK